MTKESQSIFIASRWACKALFISKFTFVLCGATQLSAGNFRDLHHRMKGCFSALRTIPDSQCLLEGFFSLVTRVATVLLSRWTDRSLWGLCPLINLSSQKLSRRGPHKTISALLCCHLCRTIKTLKLGSKYNTNTELIGALT